MSNPLIIYQIRIVNGFDVLKRKGKFGFFVVEAEFVGRKGYMEMLVTNIQDLYMIVMLRTS